MNAFLCSPNHNTYNRRTADWKASRTKLRALTRVCRYTNANNNLDSLFNLSHQASDGAQEGLLHTFNKSLADIALVCGKERRERERERKKVRRVEARMQGT